MVCDNLHSHLFSLQKRMAARVVTKISSCRVFFVSSRGSRKQSWNPLPQEAFEVQLLPFSKRHYSYHSRFYDDHVFIKENYNILRH